MDGSATDAAAEWLEKLFYNELSVRKITQLRSRLFCNHPAMQMQHSSWHFNSEISSIRLEKP